MRMPSVEAADGAAVDFEEVDVVSLKGVGKAVTLYRASARP